MTTRAAVGAAALLTALACGREPATTEAGADPQTPLVEAAEARSGALPIEEVMPGVVRARNQVTVRPEVSGRVVDVLVRSGEAVRRGQPLVRLEAEEARERLRQAEADVRLAEAAQEAAQARAAEIAARVARSRTLAEQELLSPQELETLEAQLDALQAGAQEAAARVQQARAVAEERRTALDKRTVRSPVTGRVGERRVETGMQVDSSTVLFVAGDLDELMVEVNLTEEMLATVDTGLPVVIESRAAGEPLRAELSRISPFLAQDSFTTAAEIDLDNIEGRLRPGMFVTVRVLVGQSRTATLVPLGAVWEDPNTGRRGVFVLDDTAEPDPEQPRSIAFRAVQVLAEGQGTAGVTGIEPGDWVVTLGQHLLAAELRLAARQARDAEATPGPATVAARVRPISWERVLELQNLQDEDLLEGFLEKQRTVAAALGAEIPASEDQVIEVMAEARGN